MTGSKTSFPTTLFVGAGRMASAIVQGLLATGRAQPENLLCTCGQDPTGPALAQRTGIRYVADASEGLPEADFVLLACKPQQLASLPESLAEETSGKLILSILAGIPLARLRQVAPKARNVVRVMPNTPAQIGQGISAYASDQPLSEDDQSAVEILLSSMGKTIQLEESHIDAVTALSGSGPAYVFEFTRLLAEAGKSLGLPEEVAAQLARQTVVGSAALMDKREEADPIELVREVTSPGGTTEAALKTLEGDFGKIVDRALRAARDRSRELSSM
ncbi:pyrroline-5-carboxylate reductase [Puniceicoccus vermicola]|uniref:Pyrroline-5-carboxylate reductase n=1 Tax=Puniceicoccus vermicola TaxID=388746 RepID=A0A7X1E411_9BACT|nr:pyrroline-5-carboxylate reductase [Puniceicoccus vermicola]MBC2601549.1 pyrroline-5-carboxylate reductase [Puniceicoccus vermicola]